MTRLLTSWSETFLVPLEMLCGRRLGGKVHCYSYSTQQTLPLGFICQVILALDIQDGCSSSWEQLLLLCLPVLNPTSESESINF